jgi:hypothetical protein
MSLKFPEISEISQAAFGISPGRRLFFGLPLSTGDALSLALVRAAG